MSEADKHMDDSFRKMDKEFRVSYHSSYWSEMKTMLDNESMDIAFRDAAGNFAVPTTFNGGFEAVNDAFLDEAFKTGAHEQQAVYDASAWEDFQQNRPDIEMADAFNEAAKITVTPYNPSYWNDADVALQEEGLHHEYKSDYWEEARSLLDLADRKLFFYRWSGVAGLLLLISLFGGNMVEFTQPANGVGEHIVKVESNGADSNTQNISVDSQLQEDKSNAMDERKLISDNSTLPGNYNENTLMSSQDIKTEIETAEHGSSLNEQDNDLMDQHIRQEDLIRVLAVDASVDESADMDMPNVSDIAFSVEYDDRYIKASGVKEEINEGTDQNYSPNDLLPPSGDKREHNGMYPAPAVHIDKVPVIPKNGIALVAGLGLGNEYGGVSYDPSWRSSAYLEYTRSFGGQLKRFEIGGGFGVNHIRQSGLGTERRSTQYHLDGTVTKSWFKINLTDLVYANTNVFVNYKLNEKHKLKFGVGYDRMVAVQSNMSLKDGTDEITTVNHNWGVQNGVNKQDIRLSLGYEYNVNSKLAVRLTGNFGLTDRTDNVFLQNNFTDREMNFTLGVKYNLFNKF